MASRSLNRVILIGNLTRDPELKYTPAGTAVCTFGVATNRSWTTADGSTKEEVQYHRIVAWQKLAELCGKLLTKGRKIFLEGRLTYRTFTGKDGQQRSITEIVLDDFIVFSDGRRMGETTTESVAPKDETVTAKEEVRKDKQLEGSAPAEASADKEETVNPDDIPF
ncbi:single-stranded DNA-binding protein [Candidatus Roizmanbacteria bacterium]|nr:single-stranded DNA-binding protein [Candidatus Roizmanbacteria bacterium]